MIRLLDTIITDKAYVSLEYEIHDSCKVLDRYTKLIHAYLGWNGVVFLSKSFTVSRRSNKHKYKIKVNFKKVPKDVNKVYLMYLLEGVPIDVAAHVRNVEIGVGTDRKSTVISTKVPDNVVSERRSHLVTFTRVDAGWKVEFIGNPFNYTISDYIMKISV